MRDAPALVRAYAATSRGDLAVASGLAVATLPFVVADHGLASHSWTATLTLVSVCAAIALRRRHGLTAATAIAAVCLITRLVGQLAVVNNGTVGAIASGVAIVAVFLVSYSLGEGVEFWPGLVGAALLVFAVNVADTAFNPFTSVVALGPWFAGRVVASRRKLNEQLQLRSDELEAERELFARESVRYERARIARELHDIVAHCVSVMVIQANAGQRLLAEDPGRAIAALESISEAARQADEEVGRLVDLLGAATPVGDVAGLSLVQQLVAQVAATGITITCRFEGSFDALPLVTSEVAFRVVQEGITNALKHAPGAALEIVIQHLAGCLSVEVMNDAAIAEGAGLDTAGGGHGLRGMRERVAACHGELCAGPRAGGGWRIRVALSTTAH
jgi:signal transduction histidine kinase